MEKGKGVGGDKVSAEMLLEGGGDFVAQFARVAAGVLGGGVYSRGVDGRHHCSTP